MRATAMPMARTFNVEPRPARIRSEGGLTHIEGHEKIADLSGSTTFSAARYQINPGLSLFTWLSGRANGYEKYRFKKLMFYYIAAEAVVTTPGKVYLGIDYDPDDAAPSTLAALSSYESLCSLATYETGSVKVDVARAQAAKLKVRCGSRAGSKLLYDVCSLIVASDKQTGTSAIGEIWVEYDLELISPQTEPSTQLPVATAVYNVSSSQVFTTTVAATVDFDESLVDGLALSTVNGLFTLPCGLYRVSGEISARDTSAESFKVNLQLKVNGAAASPDQRVEFYATSIASGSFVVPFTFYANLSSASGTVAISGIMTGAAGTLTALADYSRICFEAL